MLHVPGESGVRDHRFGASRDLCRVHRQGSAHLDPKHHSRLPPSGSSMSNGPDWRQLDREERFRIRKEATAKGYTLALARMRALTHFTFVVPEHRLTKYEAEEIILCVEKEPLP